MSGKAPSRAPTESSASPWLDMGMAMVRWRGMRAQRTARPRPMTRPRDGSFRCMCLACAELFPSSGLGDEPAKPAPVVLDDLLAAIGELFLHLVGEEEAMSRFMTAQSLMNSSALIWRCPSRMYHSRLRSMEARRASSATLIPHASRAASIRIATSFAWSILFTRLSIQIFKQS